MSSHPDAPPSYAQATGSSTASQPKPSRLDVPGHNGIPAAHRRSMEDEHRKLPEGWIRQFDTKNEHQFFVDTNVEPPRSIWHHPYDDEQYLATLSSEERERIQEEEKDQKKRPAYLDATDDEATTPIKSSFSSSSHAPEISSGTSTSTNADGKKATFGRRMKDKLTGMTHEERVAERAKQAEEERKYYEAHLKFRNALHRAQATGQPQFFAKDRDGHDVFVEPPQYYNGGYGRVASNINPYQAGVYQDPNNRFIAPPGAAYGRPYGNRYGGGIGLPIVGGLLGGALLGGLLF